MTQAEVFMLQALRLAEQALFISAPNPAIGCVIVRDQQIIGQGSTQAAGG
ncbi:MAG: riboflavin biosynthesis protein RibD, partial [Glaciimonas sp.]|nr:riboflavin biosynthesis protein RibD [Glaciimonas sp.]